MVEVAPDVAEGEVIDLIGMGLGSRMQEYTGSLKRDGLNRLPGGARVRKVHTQRYNLARPHGAHRKTPYEALRERL